MLRDGSALPVEASNLSPKAREALAMHVVSVPASWKSRLPQADEEGVHRLLMQAEKENTRCWTGDGMRGSFRYDSEIGLRWSANSV
jgi:hypothetical protein